MKEQDIEKLSEVIEQLGFTYEQLKSLTATMLVHMNKDKTFDDVFSFLVDLQLSFNGETQHMVH